MTPALPGRLSSRLATNAEPSRRGGHGDRPVYVVGYTFAARYALDPMGRLTAETLYLPRGLSRRDAAALNGQVGTAR